MGFRETLDVALACNDIPLDIYEKMMLIYTSYAKETEDVLTKEQVTLLFNQFLDLIKKDLKDPFQFPCHHKRITAPINLEQFGKAFFKPLIDMKKSCYLHTQYVGNMITQFNRGENVILLANHQVEADPQIMQIVLEPLFPKPMLDEMIFIAGDRVTSDPMARPFSMGCNLLCIYSKRHIDNPPEKREEKLRHNHRSMRVLKSLLCEGSKFIYVAPSGGRDRKDSQGNLEPAPFHPDSIEMFRLLGKSCSKPTHFYPMALKTFDILPPPPVVEKTIGEKRKTKKSPAHFSFGQEVHLDSLTPEPYNTQTALTKFDKKDLREQRSTQVFHIVQKLYKEITEL